MRSDYGLAESPEALSYTHQTVVNMDAVPVGSMQSDQQELHLRLLMHPGYHRLTAQIRAYRRRMGAIVAGGYMLFLLAFAFVPEVLMQPVSAGNPTPWLIPLAAFLIIGQFLVTGIYIKHVNTVFDDELQRLRREVGF